MKRTPFPAIVIVAGLLAVLGSLALAQQDKYTLQVPNGLAFSEFRGYETWQVVSISHDGPLLAAILANPVMIDAYSAGIPGNGTVPRRRQAGEDPLDPKNDGDVPRSDGAGHPA
jgi:hypothetical protein